MDIGYLLILKSERSVNPVERSGSGYGRNTVEIWPTTEIL